MVGSVFRRSADEYSAREETKKEKKKSSYASEGRVFFVVFGEFLWFYNSISL